MSGRAFAAAAISAAAISVAATFGAPGGAQAQRSGAPIRAEAATPTDSAKNHAGAVSCAEVLRILDNPKALEALVGRVQAKVGPDIGVQTLGEWHRDVQVQIGEAILLQRFGGRRVSELNEAEKRNLSKQITTAFEAMKEDPTFQELERTMRDGNRVLEVIAGTAARIAVMGRFRECQPPQKGAAPQ